MPDKPKDEPTVTRDSELEYVFRKVADVASWIPEHVVIGAGAGPQGELLAIATTRAASAAAIGRTVSPAGAAFPRTRTDHPYGATVVHLNRNGDLANYVELSEVVVAHPHVQPLPRGRYLVAGTRVQRFRDGSFEENGYVYGPDGRVEGSFLLGDGIADIQCDSEGKIWTSYFDEGIFGNYGWNEPVGASGLLCFDSAGHVTWHFQPPEGFDSMADCYALNVASPSEVYVYYYGEFAVMRISGQNRIEAWRTPIAGSGAIAVSAGHVALLGSYDQRDRLFIGRLDSPSLIDIVRHRFLFEGVDHPAGPGKLQGRGSCFTRMVGTTWFRCDIREIFAG